MENIDLLPHSTNHLNQQQTLQTLQNICHHPHNLTPPQLALLKDLSIDHASLAALPNYHARYQQAIAQLDLSIHESVRKVGTQIDNYLSNQSKYDSQHWSPPKRSDEFDWLKLSGKYPMW